MDSFSGGESMRVTSAAVQRFLSPDFNAVACIGEGVGEVDGADGLADATFGVDDADDGAHGFSNLFLCIYSLAEKQKSVYKDLGISEQYLR